MIVKNKKYLTQFTNLPNDPINDVDLSFFDLGILANATLLLQDTKGNYSRMDLIYYLFQLGRITDVDHIAKSIDILIKKEYLDIA